MSARRAVPILLLAALATSWVFAQRGRVPFSSDQAVVAIMAEDILERGAHPVFYYGSEYAGTLEPHFIALAFAIFGASTTVFRNAMCVLVALGGLGAWATAREAFGARAGFFAGLYLALGPSFLLYKGLTSDGAYASLLVLSSLSLWLMLVADRRFAESRPATGPLLGLGLCLGLAWWVHTPSVFLAAVVAAVTFAGCTHSWLAGRTLALLLAAFVLGSAPWWARNLDTGFASLRTHEMAAAGADRFTAQAIALFRDGWTILLGGRSAWSVAPTFPLAGAAALALLIALLGFGFGSTDRGAPRAARVGATVCLTAIVFLSALCLLVSRTDFREPRYLFAGYAGVAPLVGGLIDRLWSRRAVALALLAALLGLNLGSQVRAPLMTTADRGSFDFIGRIQDDLRANGVRFVYTSYWVAYRLTFLARGEVVASPLGHGEHGIVRIPALNAAVSRERDPGFLLEGVDREAMRAFLSAHGFVHQRVRLNGFVLLRGLPEAALAVIRTCSCIPATVQPGEVGVLSVEGPARAAAGGVARFEVTVRNDSPRPLSNNVHLSYHWMRGDGTVAEWDGERADTSGWPKGLTPATLLVPVRVAPGVYEIVFDLVDEKVTWFESLGATTVRRRVVVEPPS